MARIPKPEAYGTITAKWAHGIENEPGGAYKVVRVDCYGNRYEDEEETHRKALDNLFGAYAWPGGYPVFWFDCGGRSDNRDAGHVCPACAKYDYMTCKETRQRMASGRYAASIYEGDARDHGAFNCEGCEKVLIPEYDGADD